MASSVCNNSWRSLVVFLTCLVAFCTDIADCMTLPPISWNASNPMFKTSNNDHVIQVNMYDELDFICPQVQSSDGEVMEYYVIYQVSKREYDECNIYPESKAIMIVNCSNPSQRIRFTLLFEPFASIPHVPEFTHGSSYYYISTSTGHRDGISNSQQGACFYRNMKLTISVCCSSTPSTPIPHDNITSLSPHSTSNPPPTTHNPLPVTSADTQHIPNDQDFDTEATTVRPPTTTTIRTQRPSSSTTLHHRTKPTTQHPSTKNTDNLWDKTSTNPVKTKHPDTGDQNNINKPSEDDPDVTDPKKEGLTNGAQTLHMLVPAQCSSLITPILLYILPWLSWLWR